MTEMNGKKNGEKKERRTGKEEMKQKSMSLECPLIGRIKALRVVHVFRSWSWTSSWCIILQYIYLSRHVKSSESAFGQTEDVAVRSVNDLNLSPKSLPQARISGVMKVSLSDFDLKTVLPQLQLDFHYETMSAKNWRFKKYFVHHLIIKYEKRQLGVDFVTRNCCFIL